MARIEPRAGPLPWRVRPPGFPGLLQAIVAQQISNQAAAAIWARLAALPGAHREWLIARCRSADFTLRGLVPELAERSLKVDYRSVWAFVHAEGLSFKNRMARPACKQFRRHGPTGLHQRIRPMGMTPAKMEIHAFRSS